MADSGWACVGGVGEKAPGARRQQGHDFAEAGSPCCWHQGATQPSSRGAPRLARLLHDANQATQRLPANFPLSAKQ